MATKTEVVLIDDLDGTTEGVRTVELLVRVKGGPAQHVQLELDRDNSANLLAFLDQYIRVGRPVGGKAGRKRSKDADRAQNAKIREWARANGHDVPERGRISDEVRQAWLNVEKTGDAR